MNCWCFIQVGAISYSTASQVDYGWKRRSYWWYNYWWSQGTSYTPNTTTIKPPLQPCSLGFLWNLTELDWRAIKCSGAGVMLMLAQFPSKAWLDPKGSESVLLEEANNNNHYLALHHHHHLYHHHFSYTDSHIHQICHYPILTITIIIFFSQIITILNIDFQANYFYLYDLFKQNFAATFKNELYFESLIQGNVTVDEAISLQQHLYKYVYYLWINWYYDSFVLPPLP